MLSIGFLSIFAGCTTALAPRDVSDDVPDIDEFTDLAVEIPVQDLVADTVGGDHLVSDLLFFDNPLDALDPGDSLKDEMETTDIVDAIGVEEGIETSDVDTTDRPDVASWNDTSDIFDLGDTSEAHDNEPFEIADCLGLDEISGTDVPTLVAGECRKDSDCTASFFCENITACSEGQTCSSDTLPGHCVPERTAFCPTSTGDEWGDCDAIVGFFYDGTTCREAGGCGCGAGCWKDEAVCSATCALSSQCSNSSDCEWLQSLSIVAYCERYCLPNGPCNGACLMLPTGSCRIDANCQHGQVCRYADECTQIGFCLGTCTAS